MNGTPLFPCCHCGTTATSIGRRGSRRVNSSVQFREHGWHLFAQRCSRGVHNFDLLNVFVVCLSYALFIGKRVVICVAGAGGVEIRPE